MVVEVMGRDAGHIAVAAGVAGGRMLSLSPKSPSLGSYFEKIKRRKQYGRYFSIVVVAEGTKDIDGNYSQVLSEKEQMGRQVKLGGIGHWVKKSSVVYGFETRVTVLGHLQRGGSPTAFDRILATSFGAKAADLATAGDWGRMVALKTPIVSFLRIRVANPRQVGQTVPGFKEDVPWASVSGTNLILSLIQPFLSLRCTRGKRAF